MIILGKLNNLMVFLLLVIYKAFLCNYSKAVLSYTDRNCCRKLKNNKLMTKCIERLES